MLGDRSLKLKYLNPNLLLLASGPPDGVPGASLKAPRLTISLLDTVTGQVLFRQTHQVGRRLCQHAAWMDGVRAWRCDALQGEE